MIPLLLLVLAIQTPMTEAEIWRMVQNNLATAPEWYDWKLTAAARAVTWTPPASTAVMWEHTAGTLPPGLTLDATNGTLSGTPSQAGTFAFTIKATLNGVFTITRAFTVTIAAATIIDPAPPGPGIVGTAYQFQFRTTTQETIP